MWNQWLCLWSQELSSLWISLHLHSASQPECVASHTMRQSAVSCGLLLFQGQMWHTQWECYPSLSKIWVQCTEKWWKEWLVIWEPWKTSLAYLWRTKWKSCSRILRCGLGKSEKLPFHFRVLVSLWGRCSIMEFQETTHCVIVQHWSKVCDPNAHSQGSDLVKEFCQQNNRRRCKTAYHFMW